MPQNHDPKILAEYSFMPHKVIRLSIGGLQSIKKRNGDNFGGFQKRLKRFEELEFYGNKFATQQTSPPQKQMEQTAYSNIWDVTPSRECSEVKPTPFNKSPPP